MFNKHRKNSEANSPRALVSSPRRSSVLIRLVASIFRPARFDQCPEWRQPYCRLPLIKYWGLLSYFADKSQVGDSARSLSDEMSAVVPAISPAFGTGLPARRVGHLPLPRRACGIRVRTQGQPVPVARHHLVHSAVGQNSQGSARADQSIFSQSTIF